MDQGDLGAMVGRRETFITGVESLLCDSTGRNKGDKMMSKMSVALAFTLLSNN